MITHFAEHPPAEALVPRVIALCDEMLTRLEESPARKEIQFVRGSLEQPLRIAVAGRVKAGKSTFVNALLGRKIAPTDVGECTKLITVFRFGNPERLEIKLKTGVSKSMPLDPNGELPQSLGIDPSLVDEIVAWISNERLKDLTVVDTPGLSSAVSERSSVTRQFLAIDQASRYAVSRADALIFLFTQEPLSDEIGVLNAFRSTLTGVSITAFNTIAVLNKVDKLFPDSGDVFDGAKELCLKYLSILGPTVSGVVPVIGLLGETARAGQLTEQDAHALQLLARKKGMDRSKILLTPDLFLSSATEVSEETRTRLLGLLDLYGIRRCLEKIDGAKTGASQLTRELAISSGIQALQKILVDVLVGRADGIKAEWGLSSLERISYQEEGGRNSRLAELRDEIEETRLEPTMQHLNVISVLERCISGEISLPVPLIKELQRLSAEVSISGRLDLKEGSPPEALQNKILNAISRWRRLENDPGSGPGERAAAAIARRSYEGMWTVIEQRGQYAD